MVPDAGKVQVLGKFHDSGAQELFYRGPPSQVDAGLNPAGLHNAQPWGLHDSDPFFNV